MTDANLQVRRATIEDIPQLTALWQQENVPTTDLDKRFKEFQVVQSPQGEVLGTIGLQVSGNQGRLHSEAFLHGDQADALRRKLWDRISLIAQNFGLVRIWNDSHALFWRQALEFAPASADVLPKLPAEFGAAQGGWLVLQLRDEAAGTATSIDKEFALFREAERERTEKMLRQARVLKLVAAVVAVAVFALVAVWAFLFFKNYHGRQRAQPEP